MYFGKSFKKLFALLIAMLMMVGMLPLSTLAEDFDDIGDDTAVIGELQDGEAGFTDSEEPQIGAGDAEAEDAEEGEAGAGEAGSGDAEEGEAGAGDDDSSYIDGVAGISAFEEESEEAIDGAVLGLAGDTAVGDAAIDIMFAAARGVIGNATVTFYVDGNIYETIELDSESGDDWLPEDPVKPGLDFGGWYESGSTTPFDFDDDISGSLILYAKFFATVKFWVDGMQYGETQTVPEGYPVDSVQAPEKEGYTFVEWRTYQHGVFNLSELVNEHLDITARFTKDDTGEEDLYKDYWLAGPGGSVRNFVCPECGFSSGNQYTTGVRLYFYPLPLEEGIARQFALIVITCERCGVISEWQNTSNKGASLSGDGAAPSSTNNINMGEAVLVATYVTITYLPGSDGLVEHNGPGVVKKDEPWEAGWEPGVTPNQGYTFLGWKDQDGVMYGKGSSPPTSDKNYTFTAQYSNLPIVTITAKTTAKLYDGTALTGQDTGYTVSGLYYGDTVSSVDIDGSITNAGSVSSTVDVNSLVIKNASGVDVTDSYLVVTNNGTLTVMKRHLTLTSATDDKAYDGTPLTNGTVMVTGDGFVADEGATYDVTGTITDPGSVPNKFTYELDGNTIAGNYDITKAYGTLTITKSTAEIAITVKDNGKKYDGTALAPVESTVDGLPSGYTLTVAGYTGSIVNVSDSGAGLGGISGYTITRDSDGADATGFFEKATVNKGALTVMKRSAVLTSGDGSKVYDGTPLTNGTVLVSDEGFATGEGATYNVTGTITYPGTADNRFSYTLNGNTLESNYEITKVEGKLTVNANAAVITITAASDGKVYDGTALTKDGFTTSELPAGVTRVDAVVVGSQTGVGSSSNVVESYKLYDADGFDVTAYFAPAVKIPGTLAVAARLLTITAASATKGYDGTALVDGGYEITDGTLAEGQTLDSATVTGSQLYVGSSANVASDAAISDVAGTNVTSNYDISYVDGALEVTGSGAGAITITADSDSKTYDGTALTKDGFTTSDLPAGVTRVDAVVQGSQTGVGSSSNVVESYKLYDADGFDVTAYFAPAVKMPGALVVAARPLTITAASATKGYDGMALVDGGYEITDGTLAEGQ
ncbi:MAG: InlB B-repeat-containing protein, partial [Oscillospiraceae bacterium]|nr:InlB B-repeat-containing protein [Oscillospiraceae bacterium]